MKKKVIFSSVIITLISNLYANNQLNNNFFNQGKEGYFFYKDEKIVDEKDKEKKIIKTETSSIKSEYSKTKEMMDMVFENDEERETRLKKEDEFMEIHIGKIYHNKLRFYRHSHTLNVSFFRFFYNFFVYKVVKEL